MSVDENLVAFTRERAAELSGLSLRQLNYWRTTELLEPSTSEQVSPYRQVHLYTFADMLELLVIADLLQHKVPTRRVRKIVNRLRGYGYARPLTEVKWGVVGPAGKRERLAVFLQLEDGTIEGDDMPGQTVAKGSVDMVEIRAKVQRSTQRPEAAVGQVEKRRGTLGSKAVLAGTRIPVATIRNYLEYGASDAEILEAFPALQRADIEAVRAAAS
jgi:uncharacterized protein (DUF433 family)